jgi:hypothetical protein
LLQHEVGKRFAGLLEQVLDVAGAHAVSSGNVLKSEVPSSETSQYPSLDRVEASSSKSAMPGDLGDITIRSEAKRNEIEDILCGRMVGGGIELGSEPVCGLELVQQEIAQLVVRNRTRNLVLDVPANVGNLTKRNLNAPSIAFRKLSYYPRLTAVPHCHISRRKVDGPVALGSLHTTTGCKNQKQLATRFLGGNIGSTIHMQGVPRMLASVTNDSWLTVISLAK